MEMVKNVFNHLVAAFFFVVFLGGVALCWAVAPEVVDAVNVWHGDWDSLGAPLAALVEALVVFGVGTYGTKWAYARV
jgi:hypothetical protein